MMDQLETLIHSVGGIHQAARICGKHASTVRRWRRGITPMPTAAYRALYAASPWGRQDRQVMTTNERQALLQQVDAHRRRCEYLEGELRRVMRLGHFEAANDAWVDAG